MPSWIIGASSVTLTLYAAEFATRLYAERWHALKSRWNWVEGTLVVCGVLDLAQLSHHMGVLRMLKLTRLLRLLKLVRLLRSSFFKELRTLMSMIETGLRTLMWATLVMMLIMSVWSAVAVEVVHPVVQELASEGEWPDCERCSRAYSSVSSSLLTFFQTIVGGDSWGLVPLPVIERSPLTAIVLLGAIMTLNFGILQLIVCVIVDRFAEMRAKDIPERARNRRENETAEKQVLAQIFAKIDNDRNGALSFDELMSGAERVPEFAQRLTALDIGRENLRDLFDMLDEDGSGELDPREFIEFLYRTMTAESQTAVHFVRHLLMDLKRRQADFELSIDRKLDNHAGEASTRGMEASDAINRVEQAVKRLSMSTDAAPGFAQEVKLRRAAVPNEDPQNSTESTNLSSVQTLVAASFEKFLQSAVVSKLEAVIDRLDTSTLPSQHEDRVHRASSLKNRCPSKGDDRLLMCRSREQLVSVSAWAQQCPQTGPALACSPCTPPPDEGDDYPQPFMQHSVEHREMPKVNIGRKVAAQLASSKPPCKQASSQLLPSPSRPHCAPWKDEDGGKDAFRGCLELAPESTSPASTGGKAYEACQQSQSSSKPMLVTLYPSPEHACAHGSSSAND